MNKDYESIAMWFDEQLPARPVKLAQVPDAGAGRQQAAGSEARLNAPATGPTTRPVVRNIVSPEIGADHRVTIRISSKTVPRPHFLGLSFDSERAMFILMAVVFALLGMLVLALRRGRFGRRLAAPDGRSVPPPLPELEPGSSPPPMDKVPGE